MKKNTSKNKKASRPVKARKGQKGRGSKAAPQSDEATTSRQEGIQASLLSQHDVPPPLTLSEGSLILESDADFQEPRTGPPFVYRRPSSATGTGFGHIRVLHGNGEMIYQDLHPDEASIIIVTLKDEANREERIRIEGGAAFQVTSDKRMGREDGSGRKRPKKLSHPGPGRVEFRVERIEVRDHNGDVKFVATARPADEHPGSEEFRILMWLH